MLIIVLRYALIVPIVALLLSPGAGCSRYPDRPNAPVLRLRLSSNPTTLDPALITDVAAGTIAAKLFNGLVRFNDALEIVPDIAASWRIAPDQRTYTFRLRRGVRFSNGREVTARDFRYSFERVLRPETRAPLTWVLERIEGARDVISGRATHASGIRILDDHLLQIRIAEPFAPFLALLGMTTSYVVPEEECERLGPDFGSSPAGTGPYVLREWRQGQQLVLAARSDYFEGPPRLSAITYRVIPEDLTAVVEFETGRLDVLQVPASEHRRYAEDPAWKDRVFQRPGLNCYYLGLNCDRPPFSDLRLREAVLMAIDRKRILETLYERRGILAGGPIPPLLRTYAYLGDPFPLPPFDPEKARAMIKSSGWAGKEVRIYISAEPEVLEIAEVIQHYLAETGLDPRIVPLDWSAYKDAINRGDAEAFWLSWWADYPDPENFFYPLFHSANLGPAGNRSRYRDLQLDRLIEQAQSAIDDGKRNALYFQIEQRIIRNIPWIFMWHRSDISVAQRWVEGFRIYPIYSIDKGMDASVRK